MNGMDEPSITEVCRLDDKHKQIEARAVVPVDGMGWVEMKRMAIVRADLTLTPKLYRVEDMHVLDVIDADGKVHINAIQMASVHPPSKPWPRTQTIPPGVWTRLNDASVEVFQDTGAVATVTVAEDGDLTLSAPMTVRIIPEIEYDDWGDDA
jgi:hypothetical protein